jgi:hypothetical protein
MPLSTILELPEQELDDEEWGEDVGEDEELGAEDDELDLDEFDDDFEEDDEAVEL